MWGVYDEKHEKDKYFLLKKQDDNSSQPLQMDKGLLVNDIMDGDNIQCRYY